MMIHESLSRDVQHEIIKVPSHEIYFVKTVIGGELFCAGICESKKILADYLASFDDEVTHV